MEDGQQYGCSLYSRERSLTGHCDAFSKEKQHCGEAIGDQQPAEYCRAPVAWIGNSRLTTFCAVRNAITKVRLKQSNTTRDSPTMRKGTSPIRLR